MKRLKDSPFSLSALGKAGCSSIRVKSVLTPSAQSATPCAKGYTSAHACFDYGRDLLSRNDIPIVIKAVAELQYRYGLRISEVLNITTGDISHSGKIRIKALKGSQVRVVLPVDFGEFWYKMGVSLLPLHSVFSRWYFYREYKKLGWYSVFGDSSCRSVTHYFRHLQGLELQNDWNDIELTQRSLGHKSLNSTQYYVKKARK